MGIISGGKIIEGATPRGAKFENAGAPTSGASGTQVGVARVGDQLTDTTNGVLYICTNAGPGAGFAWTVVGAQT